MFGRQKIAMLLAEFLGTGILALVTLSLYRSSVGQITYFVALGIGLAFAALVALFGNVSGSHLNPAITLAMWTARRVSTVTAVLYIVVQMLGAWGAYFLYTYFSNSSLQKLTGHYDTRLLIAEAIGTVVLALGFALGVSARRTSNYAAASVSGVAYLVGILTTIAVSPLILLNPALAFAARAFQWNTYVAGPVIGAILGVNLYYLLFAQADEAAAVSAAPATATGKAAVAPVVVSEAVAPVTKKTRASKTAAKSRAAAKSTTKSTTKRATKKTTRK